MSPVQRIDGDPSSNTKFSFEYASMIEGSIGISLCDAFVRTERIIALMVGEGEEGQGLCAQDGPGLNISTSSFSEE